MTSSRSRGFTLVELLVAAIILGIILAVAMPAYQDYVRRTRRSDAKVAVTDMAQRLERCFTQFGAYNDNGCTNVPASSVSAQGFYTVAVVRTATTYTVTATAQGVQLNDASCKTFATNQFGQKSATGGGSDCW